MKEFFEEWKLKRAFKKMLKPRKSFEQWAEEHGVIITKPTKTPKQRVALRWAAVATSFVLLIGLVLPITLRYIRNQNNVPDPTPPTIYSSQDTVSPPITMQELYRVEKLLLFDENQILEYGGIFKDTLLDDSTFILSYTIDDCFIITKDELNGFFIDFKIRTYAHYEFYSYNEFSELSQSFYIDDVTIDYKISETLDLEKTAYLSFAYDEMEYFLQVKGFPNVTEISEETLVILINDLLT